MPNGPISPPPDFPPMDDRPWIDGPLGAVTGRVPAEHLASMQTELIVFTVFGLTSQAVLVAFFAARRWGPRLADRFGWVAYAFGFLGLGVGAWLAASGASWRLFAGPLLFAVWAAYGAWVDLVRRVEWRPRAETIRKPVQWNFLGPYVTLYLAAQMFLWWPLWDSWRPGWTAYLVLFVANTLLNVSGHFGSAPRSSTRVA